MATTDVTRGPAPREALLARALVELAGTLVAGFDVVELLTCSPSAASRWSMLPPPV